MRTTKYAVTLSDEERARLRTLIGRGEGTARRLAREYAARYLATSNYTTNLERLGYTEAEFADGGSDRLIDAVVPHGSAEAIAEVVRAHLDAGADHVCVQVQPAAGDVLPTLAAVAGELRLPTGR